MLNSDIRKTAGYILRTSAVPLFIFSAFSSLYIYIALIINELTGSKQFYGIVAGLVIFLIVAVPVAISVFSGYFHIYTWIFGKARLSYITRPLKDKKPAKSFIPLILLSVCLYIFPIILWLFLLIAWLLSLVVNPEYLIINPKIAGALVLISFILILYIFAVVKMAWYIWALKPEYSAFSILKRAFRYVANYWTSWLWFTFTTNSIPAIIWAISSSAFNVIIATVIFIPFSAYISLTQAAYVYENILKIEFGNETAYSYAIKEITDNWTK